MLRNAADPGKRLQAVMATRQMSDAAAIPILRLALKDPDDDVRLLAYAMLSGKEETINARIKQQLSHLDTEQDPLMQFQLHQRIATDYWEIAYLGLAEGEVLAHALQTARRHAGRALEKQPDGAGSYFLLGRILLRQGHVEQAHTAFVRARELGLPEVELLPYLAEIAFKQRRFHDVRALLGGLDPLARTHPALSGVADYWL